MSTRDDERTVAERAPHPFQDLRRLGGQAAGIEGGRIGQGDGVDFAERLERTALDERVESLDRSGLEDVQRLALGLSDVGIEQKDAAEDLAGGQAAGQRRAQLARSDDGDGGRHGRGGGDSISAGRAAVPVASRAPRSPRSRGPPSRCTPSGHRRAR
jgi:hypothetical protein